MTGPCKVLFNPNHIPSMKSPLLSLAISWGLLLIATPALRAQGAVAARLAAELTEQLAKKGTSNAAQELAKMGGDVAVREVLEQAEKEGGEALVKSLADHAGKYGIVALQAAKGSPRAVIAAVDKLPKDLAERGLQAIAREPQVMQKLLSETGQEALEAAARHPGIGTKIAQTLGREGAETAAKLTDDAAVVLARHADDIAKLPAAERTGLLTAMRTQTARALKFLEKHPKTLLTAATVTAFIAGKDELLGTSGAPGFLERMFAQPVRTVGYVIAGLLALWGTTTILFSLRASRRARR